MTTFTIYLAADLGQVQVGANNTDYRTSSTLYEAVHFDIGGHTSNPQYRPAVGLVFTLPAELEGYTSEDVTDCYLEVTANSDHTGTYPPGTPINMLVLDEPNTGTGIWPSSRNTGDSPVSHYNEAITAGVSPINWTTGNSAYVGSWTAGEFHRGPDLTAHLQDIMDAGGGAGDRVMLLSGWATDTNLAVRVNSYESGTNGPRLVIELTATGLKFLTGESTSSGRARLTPLRKLAHWTGERVEDIGTGKPIVPQMTSGAHSLPPTWMDGCVNPNGLEWLDGSPLGPRLKWSTPSRYGRTEGSHILLEPYATQASSFGWDLDHWQEDYDTVDTYSARFYWVQGADAFAGTYPIVCEFMLGSTVQWYIQLDTYDIFNPSLQMRMRLVGVGVASTSWTSNTYTGPGSVDGKRKMYRFEVQVSDDVTPKVTVRAYADDSTTPRDTLSFSPTAVNIDRIRFRYPAADGSRTIYVSDIEMWNDYILGGQFPEPIDNTTGTPYLEKDWAWWEYDGTQWEQLDDLGLLVSTSPTSADGDALTDELYTASVYPGTGSNPYTKYSALAYGTGSYRTLDLYVPTAGSGPYPVAIFTHGGFFISGNDETINDGDLVNVLVTNGIAVVSMRYVLGTIAAPTTYSTSSATGRYESFILNTKEVGHWVDTTGASTYNLDPDAKIQLGHSAGGYLALGAVVSNGIADGAGRSLTLAGNTGTFSTPNAADPTYLSCYVWSAPVNMNSLVDYDPATRQGLDMGGSDQGNLGSTARIFMNRAYGSGSTDCTDTGIDELVATQATSGGLSTIPPTCYAYGGGDFLVPSVPVGSMETSGWSQAKLLRDAYDDAGIGNKLTVWRNDDALHHTVFADDLDIDHLIYWLRTSGGL